MLLRSLKQWKHLAEEAWGHTATVAKFFCCLHVTNTYLCTFASVYGPSMLPTFNVTGDLVLAERISTHLGKVAPGDIVLVRSPQNPRKITAKRVTGMEGNLVQFLVDPKNSDHRGSVIVPKGHVWIQGDNIYDSNDSRNFGPVPYALLQGRIFWRVWPIDRVGSVD